MTVTWVLYLLHSLAALLQVGGGLLVVRDARFTLHNIRGLKAGLETAQAKKDDHRKELESMSHGRSVPSPLGGTISLPGVNPAVHDALIEQLGPGAAAERQALRDFLTAQFSERHGGTVWGVILLFAGIALGWIANMIGVNPNVF